eukprot:6459161-Amphidinium_carterae.2
MSLNYWHRAQLGQNQDPGMRKIQCGTMEHHDERLPAPRTSSLEHSHRQRGTLYTLLARGIAAYFDLLVIPKLSQATATMSGFQQEIIQTNWESHHWLLVKRPRSAT